MKNKKECMIHLQILKMIFFNKKLIFRIIIKINNKNLNHGVHNHKKNLDIFMNKNYLMNLIIFFIQKHHLMQIQNRKEEKMYFYN